MTGAAPTASGSALTSYVRLDTGYDHIVYLDANSNVDLLYYANGSWHWGGLGGPAASGSALTSFADSGNVEHVFYLNANSHVHQLYYNGSWHDQDLTAITGAAPAASGSDLTSFADRYGQHLAFLGGNQHVFQMYYNGNWTSYDLTALAGASLAASGSHLASYYRSDINNENIDYLDSNGHVHRLVYNGSSWSDQDLTAIT